MRIARQTALTAGCTSSCSVLLPPNSYYRWNAAGIPLTQRATTAMVTVAVEESCGRTKKVLCRALNTRRKCEEGWTVTRLHGASAMRLRRVPDEKEIDIFLIFAYRFCMFIDILYLRAPPRPAICRCSCQETRCALHTGYRTTSSCAAQAAAQLRGETILSDAYVLPTRRYGTFLNMLAAIWPPWGSCCGQDHQSSLYCRRRP